MAFVESKADVWKPRQPLATKFQDRPDSVEQNKLTKPSTKTLLKDYHTLLSSGDLPTGDLCLPGRTLVAGDFIREALSQAGTGRS